MTDSKRAQKFKADTEMPTLSTPTQSKRSERKHDYDKEDKILAGFEQFWERPLEDFIKDYQNNEPFSYSNLLRAVRITKHWQRFKEIRMNLERRDPDTLEPKELNLLGFYHHVVIDSDKEKAKNYFRKSLDSKSEKSNTQDQDVAHLQLAMLHKEGTDALINLHLNDVSNKSDPNIVEARYYIEIESGKRSINSYEGQQLAAQARNVGFNHQWLAQNQSDLEKYAKEGNAAALGELANKIAMTHPDKAIRYLEIAYQHGYERAVYSLAKLHKQLEKFNDAETVLKQAVANKSEHAVAHLAVFYLEQGEWEKAYNLYKTTDKNPYQIWHALGKDCEKIGALEYASYCYAKYDPNDYDSKSGGAKQREADLELKAAAEAVIAKSLFEAFQEIRSTDQEKAAIYLRLSILCNLARKPYYDPPRREQWNYFLNDGLIYINHHFEGGYSEYAKNAPLTYHAACTYAQIPEHAEANTVKNYRSLQGNGTRADYAKQRFIELATNPKTQGAFIDLYLKNPDTHTAAETLLGRERLQKVLAAINDYKNNRVTLIDNALTELKTETSHYLNHVTKELKSIGNKNDENAQLVRAKHKIMQNLTAILDEESKDQSTDAKALLITRYQHELKKGKETLAQFRTFGATDSIRQFFNVVSAIIFPIAIIRIIANYAFKGTAAYWSATGELFEQKARSIATKSLNQEARLKLFDKQQSQNHKDEKGAPLPPVADRGDRKR